jgi:predicted DNA-binding protein
MQRNICTTISLELNQLQTLENIAKVSGKSKSQIVREAIDRYLTELNET